MFRAILPDGDIQCADYDRSDRGVELFTPGGELIAFVPYDNLVALINEEVRLENDRAVM